MKTGKKNPGNLSGRTGWPGGNGVILLPILLFGGYYLLKNLLAVPDVEVPEVEGLVLEEAEKELDEAGLNFSKVFKYHEIVEEDHVISQDPAGGSKVKKSREVVLEVSKGRELIKVPEVTNMPQREASLLLGQSKLEFQIEEEFNSKVEAGYVIRQDPRPGVQLYQGDEVILYISKGERSFPIRNLVGEREVDVKMYLSREGLIINKEKDEFSDLPPGTVVEQYPPAGTDVKPGDLVDIVWSKGQDPGMADVEWPSEEGEHIEVGEPH